MIFPAVMGVVVVVVVAVCLTNIHIVILSDLEIHGSTIHLSNYSKYLAKHSHHILLFSLSLVLYFSLLPSIRQASCSLAFLCLALGDRLRLSCASTTPCSSTHLSTATLQRAWHAAEYSLLSLVEFCLLGRGSVEPSMFLWWNHISANYPGNARWRQRRETEATTTYNCYR